MGNSLVNWFDHANYKLLGLCGRVTSPTPEEEQFAPPTLLSTPFVRYLHFGECHVPAKLYEDRNYRP